MIGRAAGDRTPVALLLLALTVIVACRSAPQPAAPTTTPTPTTSLAPTPSGEPLVLPEPPPRDLFDLAVRFGRVPPGSPRPARQSPLGHKEGEVREFHLIDLEPPRLRTVRAVLKRISEHAYFFFEEGVTVDDDGLAGAAADFEATVYPTLTDRFGPEPSPGIDADPRITLLHAHLQGAGGYVSSADQFTRPVSPRSNQRDILYIDAGLPPGSPSYNALLAHELQHLIHWNADPDEEAWVNEGLSQVAAETIDFQAGAIASFLLDPDLQLNNWSLLEDDPTPHYGASQLFFRYLLDRFGGRERASDLLSQPANGIAGVNGYLRAFDTGFAGAFADWLAANYLDAASGPYAHQGTDMSVSNVTLVHSLGPGQDTVAQFAADYLEVDPPSGGAVFRFDGTETVPALDLEPASGSALWWSNRGDSIDSRLTCELDLSDVNAASLRFSTWYEIEEGWDYAYVSASSDGGVTWQPLPGRHTSDYNPVAVAYGPSYTGHSGQTPPGGQEKAPRWVEELIDLTPFAGGPLLIRFEYVTDDATNLRGFAVDDIAVPEIDFRDGAEAKGPCRAKGFVRLDRPLSQRFILLAIDREKGEVRNVGLEEGNRARIPVSRPLTLVVAAATDVTVERAHYRWELTPP
ncbi:MAG: hypothetical protein ACE5KW_02255 [Dehalococcoidia bacterium]